MKSFFLVFFITLSTVNSRSQNPIIQKQKSLNLSILGIGYDYECPVSDMTSILISGELGYGFSKVYGFESDQNFKSAIAPIANFEMRRYYNLEKRNFLSKNTSGNSANFFSLNLGYVFSPLAGNLRAEEGPYIMPSWGVQRKVFQSFHFEFETMLYFYSFNKPLQEKPFIVGVGMNMKFGYVFGSKD